MTVSLTKVKNPFDAERASQAIRSFDAEIARLTSARALAVETLLNSVEGTGKVTLDDGTSFTVSEVNTYDEAVMLANLLPGQVKRCSVSRLDKATVKRLYTSVYNGAKVNKGRKVAMG